MRNTVSNCLRKEYGESSVDCVGSGNTAEFVAGEYAGGATSSLKNLGRRVGVVVGNGFVVLLFATAGDDGDILEERDRDDGNDDLGSFFEVNRLRLKGMLLSLEDVLICEQKVGAGERVAIVSKLCYARGKSALAELFFVELKEDFTRQGLRSLNRGMLSLFLHRETDLPLYPPYLHFECSTTRRRRPQFSLDARLGVFCMTDTQGIIMSYPAGRKY